MRLVTLKHNFLISDTNKKALERNYVFITSNLPFYLCRNTSSISFFHKQKNKERLQKQFRQDFVRLNLHCSNFFPALNFVNYYKRCIEERYCLCFHFARTKRNNSII